MSGQRLGFILCSSLERPLPSTRIAVLNLQTPLLAAGYSISILHAPSLPTETPTLQLQARQIAEHCDVVVFQKTSGPSVVALAAALHACKVHTVFMVCDRVNVEMVAATDATIVVTSYLRSLYPRALQAKIHVVHDGIENPTACKQEWLAGSGSRAAPLQAVLVTSAALGHLPAMPALPHWLRVNIVGQYPRLSERLPQLRKQWSIYNGGERLRLLGFLMNRRIRRVAWDGAGVYRELAQADIGILPITPGAPRWGNEHAQAWRRKSENRLTLKMAMGLPVIATPIPAYEELIDPGVNGFLAQSKADWTLCLSALRDPARRRAMGAAARASVLPRYSVDSQVAAFIAVLDGLH
jgi:hypothetical protein